MNLVVEKATARPRAVDAWRAETCLIVRKIDEKRIYSAVQHWARDQCFGLQRTHILPEAAIHGETTSLFHTLGVIAMILARFSSMGKFVTLPRILKKLCVLCASAKSSELAISFGLTPFASIRTMCRSAASK